MLTYRHLFPVSHGNQSPFFMQKEKRIVNFRIFLALEWYGIVSVIGIHGINIQLVC